MKKEEINTKELKAIEEIQNSYDAFYIENKYGDGTHKKEFDILYEFAKDKEMTLRALNWIKGCYDCYYKNDYIDIKETAFAYILKLIREEI